MYKQKLKSITEQKAGTRTLIQGGTLLKRSGFLEYCGIEVGIDLQLDLEHQDKAAMLMGILLEAFEKMPPQASSEQLRHWKAKGNAVIKMQKAKKYRL